MQVPAVTMSLPAREERSWPDRIIVLAEALPGPSWVAWLGLAAAMYAILQLIHWAVGDGQVGSLSPVLLLEATFGPIFLGSMQALNGKAEAALRALRPALETDDEGVARLARDLIRTPRRWVNAGLVLGTLLGIASLLGNPAAYGLSDRSSAMLWFTEGLFSVISVVTLLAFIVHAVHQLDIVVHVHRDLVRVDVFHLDPLYAFAGLTARTGTILIAVVVYGFGALSVLTAFKPGLLDLAMLVAIVGVAVGCFVVPLLGLHERIVAEKRRRRAEVNQTLDRALAEIRTRVLAGDHAEVTILKDAVMAATSGIETINHFSTWPWRPETLRGFLSAVALPIVIWVITLYLGRALV